MGGGDGEDMMMVWWMEDGGWMGVGKVWMWAWVGGERVLTAQHSTRMLALDGRSTETGGRERGREREKRGWMMESGGRKAGGGRVVGGRRKGWVG